ncbi:hypothetical protein ACFYPB_07840 [Streptomyces olivaceoviridis]|uniref:hypothetical protein n=1 Tax=Streptomyces olivaceoviridis TaxID=1921 RepID=UPI003678A02B
MTNLRPRTSAFFASVALTAVTGCGVTSAEGSDDVTYAGISTSSDAADAVVKASSGIHDLIEVEGKPSDGSPGVQGCAGKDRDTYFRIFHKWSFYPASAADLDVAMENLKEGLPKQGWKIVQYGPDTSANRNVVLIADNDGKRAGVHIAQMKKRNAPKLSLTVVSGCYQVPDGQEVEHF